MARSYVLRGVAPHPRWEPRKGETVYLGSTRTTISRIGTDPESGVPYVWFRPPVRGTVAMSVRNLKAVARITAARAEESAPPDAVVSYRRTRNPATLIPSRWTRAQVMRTARGQVKIKLPAGRPRRRR